MPQALSSAGEKLVVVDFGANWCKNCKAITPALEELASEYQVRGGEVAFHAEAEKCLEPGLVWRIKEAVPAHHTRRIMTSAIQQAARQMPLHLGVAQNQVTD